MTPQNVLHPPLPFILESLHKSQVIPFLGSGASMSGRGRNEKWTHKAEFLPSSGELAEYLAKKADFPRNESKELTKVSQYFQVVTGREPLEQELHRIFELNCPHNSLHHFLAEISVPLLVVTTNYDDLIERAFDARGRKYDLVIHTTEPKHGDRIFWKPYGQLEPQKIIPNKLNIDLDSVAVIYKMHGTISRSDSLEDQYIITEDDYINFLVRMNKNSAIPAIFVQRFQECHFLFLGYGLQDWNMRVVLNRVGREWKQSKKRSKDKVSWAIQNKPSPLEIRFWENRGVGIYDLEIDEFVQMLKKVKVD